ncbi:sodium-dependent multivitamin transporter-like [Saccoglossus kowalevskii]|uniref:Sodium-dependent multivitamin transporter-like n=1 Tax=Saccoglossus kowalevskii TaxID=10224 RepID=A0ABM0MTS8_SACKO|nr:PREDICTED: sodium-dependent multivitamin transporter-like [Saccoglossus kowalevskii]
MSTEAIPFHPIDKVIFAAMLAVSAFTGIYHALANGGQHTTSRYLLADQKMGGLPVAMSLLVSFMSPITILGTPAEVYLNGIMYVFLLLAFIWVYPVVAVLFVPVFHGLDIKSAYEYLGLRFNFPLRMLASTIFIIQSVFYMAVCLIGPALAFEAVQKFEVWKTVVITGVVCTFYTSVGGMKAVIWTDVFQFMVMLVTVIAVIVMGSAEAGGMGHVWENNAENGRLDVLNFSFDPSVRLTLPNLVIGGGFNYIPVFVSQAAVQRFMTTKSLKESKMDSCTGPPSQLYLMLTCFFSGYNITPEGDTIPHYGPEYTSPDQILVYFVSSQFGRIPGVQGLFIACISAGTLSSVSSCLSALIAVTLEDFIKPFRRWRSRRRGQRLQEDDTKDTLISKCLTCMYGAAGIGLAFIASYIGTFVTMGNTIFGTTGGPMLGAFGLGMLYKRANGIGVFIGTLLGFTIGLWVAIGNIIYRDIIDEVSPIYKLSFMWYSVFSVVITTVVGITSSEILRLIFPKERLNAIDPKLLATCLRPRGWQTIQNDDGEKELEAVESEDVETTRL